jgi:hypothetical protein
MDPVATARGSDMVFCTSYILRRPFAKGAFAASGFPGDTLKHSGSRCNQGTKASVEVRKPASR